MIGQIPKERLKEKFTPNEDDWFTKLSRLVDFGKPPSTTQKIIATRAIQAIVNSIIRLQSATGGSVDITANPQISAGYDGQEIILEGQDNTKTVKLDNGDGLQLAGGASFTLTEGDILKLHFNKSRSIWIENYRSTN